MNNEEAKFILTAYRPGGEDASDPRFREALEQARRDPDLAQWFASERRFDAATSDAICAIPVPANLRQNILAGGKISRPALWRRRPAVFALAAALVIAAAIVGLFNRPQRLDTWQRDALAVVPKIHTGEAKFDHEADDARVLQQWLEAHHAPSPPAIPVSLATLPTLGCKTMLSAGKPVSIICFKLPSGELVHLVVTDASNLSHALPSEPRFRKEDGWVTASWSENGRACMLATKSSERELRDLLTPRAQAAKKSDSQTTKI